MSHKIYHLTYRSTKPNLLKKRLPCLQAKTFWTRKWNLAFELERQNFLYRNLLCLSITAAANEVNFVLHWYVLVSVVAHARPGARFFRILKGSKSPSRQSCPKSDVFAPSRQFSRQKLIKRQTLFRGSARRFQLVLFRIEERFERLVTGCWLFSISSQ